MAFTILNASKYTKELKVRIQKTGRLGFSASTQETLRIDANTYIAIAKDDEAPADDCLAMVVYRAENKEAFPVSQSSGYYYLQTANLFDALGYDYRADSIYFNLKRAADLDEALGGEVYQMHQRKAKGRGTGAKGKGNENEDDTIPFDEE